jgi:hypothetical protein
MVISMTVLLSVKFVLHNVKLVLPELITVLSVNGQETQHQFVVALIIDIPPSLKEN